MEAVVDVVDVVDVVGVVVPVVLLGASSSDSLSLRLSVLPISCCRFAVMLLLCLSRLTWLGGDQCCLSLTLGVRSFLLPTHSTILMPFSVASLTLFSGMRAFVHVVILTRFTQKLVLSDRFLRISSSKLNDGIRRFDSSQKLRLAW